VTYSDIKGGWTGTGNIDVDPQFADAGSFDLHLLYTSPCRDAGDDTAVIDTEDFEGDPRIAVGAVDMGADEFHRHLYYTGDATPGGNIKGKFVGLPGTSPLALFLGAGVLDPPAKTMWGYYYLAPPWLMIGPLGSIPADGILVLSTTLPATPPAPYDVPMQALIGDSLTNLSVLEVR
jgi:hypothetical protein